MGERAIPLREVKGGWFAMGDGWAVFGATQEEALVAFDEAERRNAEIDARPLPGEDGTPFERFQQLARKLAAVPKQEVDEQRATQKGAHARGDMGDTQPANPEQSTDAQRREEGVADG